MPIGSSFRPATPRAQGMLPGRRSAFGLGFYYAGARALLVSHWAIDSDAAVLLTTYTPLLKATSPWSRGGAGSRDAVRHRGQSKTRRCPPLFLGAIRGRW